MTDERGAALLLEVAGGVALGSLFSVPLALAGGVLGARTGVERERWYQSAFSAIGRIPTLLTSVFLGIWALRLGWTESGRFWGVAGAIAGLPVIWRIVAGALSELPTGILESAAALGLSRFRTLWLSGLPVVAPALGGAVLVGAARALTVGWVISEFRLWQGTASMPEWGWLALIVIVMTLAGSLLLGASRRCSRDLERAAS